MAKTKKLDFAFFWVDFLIFGFKKTFIYIQKAYTKAAILRYFDSECNIYIKTDALGYAIGKVLSQITLEQHFSNYVTYKYANFSKFEISS